MCLRVWLPLLLLAWCSCRQTDHVALGDLRQGFVRPEFQPDFDGWGAARRRRLLMQFFVAQGQGFNMQAEPSRKIQPPDKYRLTHLLVAARKNQHANGPVRSVTYALVQLTTRPRDGEQRECDKRLFAALEQLVGAAQRAEQLRFTMDTQCRSGAAASD